MNQGFEVEWNQLWDYMPDSTEIYGGVTYTIGGNSYTLNGTCTARTTNSHYRRTCPIYSGHRYAVRSDGTRFTVKNTAVTASNVSFGISCILQTASAGGIEHWLLSGVVGQTYNDFVVYPYCIDLTQMFGSGNEPTTAAEFEAWLQENGINPNEYIPYNAGEKRKMTKPSWLL